MLSTEETAALLRAVLPLMRLPAELGEASVALCVDSAADVLAERDGEVIGVKLEAGSVRDAPEAIPVADAWLRGTVVDWIDVLFDRGAAALRLGGAPDLSAVCAGELRGALAADECPHPTFVH
jgi:hypothetical protein